MKKKSFISAFLPGFLLVWCISCAADPLTNKKAEILIKDIRIKAEVADNPAKRTMGLSFRKRLAKNSGMLFLFPAEGDHSFWMKDCFLDLDIAFIDKSGQIIKITTMKKQPQDIPDSFLKIYSAGSNKVKYALEMNSGWYEANGIKKGDLIKLPSLEEPAG